MKLGVIIWGCLTGVRTQPASGQAVKWGMGSGIERPRPKRTSGGVTSAPALPSIATGLQALQGGNADGTVESLILKRWSILWGLGSFMYIRRVLRQAGARALPYFI